MEIRGGCKMSTHGVFVLRDGDYIWGWHMLADGYNTDDFFELNKKETDKEVIFKKACEFFCMDEYEDRSYLNFFREKYDEKKDYANWTNYGVYFDGEKWNVGYRNLGKGKMEYFNGKEWVISKKEGDEEKC